MSYGGLREDRLFKMALTCRHLSQTEQMEASLNPVARFAYQPGVIPESDPKDAVRTYLCPALHTCAQIRWCRKQQVVTRLLPANFDVHSCCVTGYFPNVCTALEYFNDVQGHKRAANTLDFGVPKPTCQHATAHAEDN